MRHDPLCPLMEDGVQGPLYLYECPCDLIARVRADERRRYVDGLDRIIREVDTAERESNHLINPTGYDPAATENRP